MLKMLENEFEEILTKNPPPSWKRGGGFCPPTFWARSAARRTPVIRIAG